MGSRSSRNNYANGCGCSPQLSLPPMMPPMMPPMPQMAPMMPPMQQILPSYGGCGQQYGGFNQFSSPFPSQQFGSPFSSSPYSSSPCGYGNGYGF